MEQEQTRKPDLSTHIVKENQTKTNKLNHQNQQEEEQTQKRALQKAILLIQNSQTRQPLSKPSAGASGPAYSGTTRIVMSGQKRGFE